MAHALVMWPSFGSDEEVVFWSGIENRATDENQGWVQVCVLQTWCLVAPGLVLADLGSLAFNCWRFRSVGELKTLLCESLEGNQDLPLGGTVVPCWPLPALCIPSLP